MKKLLSSVSLVLALATLLTVPAAAMSLLTSDSFSDASKAEWVADRYPADEFDNADGSLYVSVGNKGRYASRPDGQKDSYYALQGSKLPITKKPTTNTWTATVKMNLDDGWFSSSSNKKRVEFRVDLVDGGGNALADSPTIALVKAGAAKPTVQVYNPEVKNKWALMRTFVNGDKEKETLDLEEDWHTLLINCSKGVITYYIDEKKLGACTLSEKDVYPSFVAIGVRNYELPYTVEFDNCYLYNGSYIMRQMSNKKSDEREEKLSDKYERKRQNWEDKYTEVKIRGLDEDSNEYCVKYGIENEDYTQKKLLSKFKNKRDVLEAFYDDYGNNVDTELTKEIPDSYYDY